MPTAAVAKLEKQGSLDANDPLRQGIVMVEHKIRNLEKRKAKLDGYRDLQKSGKDLNTDQLEAISKYDAVIQQLEFAKELSKHLTSLALDAVKNIKKQARKDAQEKAQQDLARTKEMLMLQEVLTSMGQDPIREDFLHGKAKVTVTSEELQQIDELFIELTPKRDEPNAFQDMFQGPAEVMSHLLEGKNKETCGTTYAALKAKLLDIAKSGYFDNAQPEPVEPVVEEVQQAVVPPVAEEAPVNVPVNIPIEQAPVMTVNFQPSHVNQMPAAVVPTQVPPQPSVPVPVPVVMPPLAQPEEIRNPNAIETTYFTPSHLRVFQSGTIDFMQENELDTPDHVEAPPSIPTMTYTNQSFTPMEPAPQPAPVVVPSPPQPEPQQIYQNQTDEEKGWSHAGGDSHHLQPSQPLAEESSDWCEAEPTSAEDSWATQAEQQWTQPAQAQQNDGFIMQGGRGRGGRGRGGGDRNQKGGNYNARGSRPSRGGYNNREGGYNNREGGGYGSGGGNYKDQNSYQNGYQSRSERGGRGRGGGQPNDRQGGGRGRGGSGGRPGGGYRGGSGGGYRQQQQ
ncbi:unnamed protein product [Nezara viridula]|uniref:Caprin-1 dimerization domain-containing protein n=1 Tax=Nezara viridula TaxID=85310 RepID=A0A9P0HFC4_NEZVI|nr:unnamed protein product [Nezara viridula]